MSSRFPIRSLVVIFVCGLLVGCGALDKDAPDKVRYMIEVERPELAASRGTNNLEVRGFEVEAAWALKSLVYRSKDGKYTADFYNEFFVAPGEMLAGACRAWIRRAGLFAIVQTGGSVGEPTHILEGDVVDLYGDYGSEGSYEAVVTINFVLLDAKNENSLVFQKQYSAREPVADKLTASLMASWNRACASVFAELEADILRSLGG